MSLADKITADKAALDAAQAQLTADQSALDAAQPHLSAWADIKSLADTAGGEIGAGLHAIADRMLAWIDG